MVSIVEYHLQSDPICGSIALLATFVIEHTATADHQSTAPARHWDEALSHRLASPMEYDRSCSIEDLVVLDDESHECPTPLTFCPAFKVTRVKEKRIAAQDAADDDNRDGRLTACASKISVLMMLFGWLLMVVQEGCAGGKIFKERIFKVCSAD